MPKSTPQESNPNSAPSPTSDTALNPTVFKLGLVSFFADVASEMLYPVTPIFLTTVLGASMASLGLIEGVAEALASLLKIYSGSWSDRLAKRKPFVAIGYFLGAISKPMIGFSTSWLHVLFARALDRTGKGIRSAPRDALIADSVIPAQSGAAYGWHRGMDTLGAAVGPLLAIFLMNQSANDLRPLYYWALVPGLISVFLVLSVKESQMPASPSIQKTHTKNYSWKEPFLSWHKMTPPFKQYLVAWSVFSLTNSSDVFLLMKAKSSGLSIQLIIFIYCAYNLVYALASPYLGKLSDQIDRKKLLIAGLLIFCLVYLGFSQASQIWHYWVLFLIYGLYMGATDGVGKALAVDLSLPDLKGTTLGLLGTATGLATIIASVAAGKIWDSSGSTWTFFYGSSGALIAVLLLLKIPHHQKSIAIK